MVHSIVSQAVTGLMIGMAAGAQAGQVSQSPRASAVAVSVKVVSPPEPARMAPIALEPARPLNASRSAPAASPPGLQILSAAAPEKPAESVPAPNELLIALGTPAYLKAFPQGDQAGDDEQRQREQERRDEEQQRTEERHQREQERVERLQELYQSGSEALDERRWDKAIQDFEEVTKQGGNRADGALYWKAYAQNKLGRRSEALATIAELEKSHPHSRWLNDARALEVEIRQASGQNVVPTNDGDEDLKLMALNGLMNSDPDRALPLLEKTLQSGAQSREVKQKALFVLAQSGSARAREILTNIARGNSNPDLQRKALEDLALFGGKESHQILAEVYASTSDVEVKRSILHDFMISGEREKVFTVAKGEKDPDLRLDAIHQLGIMGGQDELWQLYQTESSVQVKEAILHSMFVGGNIQRLVEVAKNEQNPDLRRAAIHSLGISGQQSGPALVSIYQNNKDESTREAVIEALFVQGNAHGLVDLARRETDSKLKKDIVSKLAIMNSKDAADYMLEIVNK